MYRGSPLTLPVSMRAQRHFVFYLDGYIGSYENFEENKRVNFVKLKLFVGCPANFIYQIQNVPFQIK